MKGRIPTPTKILNARGSRWSKGRQNEPKPAPETPTCPIHLDREGKAEWRRQVKGLMAMGIMARIDRGALAAYCDCWSEFMRLVQAVNKLPKIQDAVDAGLLRAKNAAAIRLNQLAQQFGFSPAARTRIKTVDEKEKPADGKAKFFRVG